MSSSGVISSVTDSGGNTDVDNIVDVTNTGSPSTETIIFSATNIATALTSTATIVVHFSTTPSRVAVSVAEFSGIASANPDRTASTTGSSTGPSSPATAATTQVNELIIGAIGFNSSTTTVSAYGSGYTALTAVAVSGSTGTIAPEYRIVSATGTYSAGETLSATANWAAGIATYAAKPTVSSLSPNAGNASGGTSTIITGSNFTGATAVAFGSTAATSFTVNSATQITATAPSQSAGTVNVTVTTDGTASATSPADQFTYIAFSPTTLTAGTVGATYSQTITPSGGTSPYTFAVTSGSLPAGLTLTTGGVVSGAPTTAGSASFTLTVTDNAGHAASQAYTLTVNKASTTTVVSNAVNPSVYGQTVTFTATVSVTSPGSGSPTGTVTFRNGSTVLGSVALIGSSATYSTSTLSAGSYTITAVYGSDANFNAIATSAAFTQTVNKATSTITWATPPPSCTARP